MSGNTLGHSFTVTTFGESHGEAIGCVIDGCPPGLAISVEEINQELERRRPGMSRYTTQRRETDQVNILSGVFEGQTTGAPICLLINNVDAKSKDYEDIKHKFRPGHADFTYQKKYGIRDYRGGGRSSARETASWVAAAAIAKKYLRHHYDVNIQAYCQQIGELHFDMIEPDFIDKNPFFCPDPNKISSIEDLLNSVRKAGDSIGACVQVTASNVPIGLGEPVFAKLDADIAHAMMSINAAKGVEIGDGFRVAAQKGSEHRDEMSAKGFHTNHSGGILGGISSGQDVVVRLALKPTSSILLPAKTITVEGEETEISTKGRHDPCVGIRAVPVAEAMLALVLMDHVLRDRAQNGTRSNRE